MDPGQHLLHLEGLGDVIVRPHLKAGYLVLQLALGGEHDDGGLAGLPDLLADCPAVHAGQHDVQHHQIRLELVEFLQPRQSVPGDLALHLLLFQIDAQQVGNILVIFHDQYFSGHVQHLLSMFREKAPGSASSIATLYRNPPVLYRRSVNKKRRPGYRGGVTRRNWQSLSRHAHAAQATGTASLFAPSHIFSVRFYRT